MSNEVIMKGNIIFVQDFLHILYTAPICSYQGEATNTSGYSASAPRWCWFQAEKVFKTICSTVHQELCDVQVLCTNFDVHQSFEYQLCVHQSCPAVFAMYNPAPVLCSNIVVSCTTSVSVPMLWTSAMVQCCLACTLSDKMQVCGGTSCSSRWPSTVLLRQLIQIFFYALNKMFFRLPWRCQQVCPVLIKVALIWRFDISAGKNT